MDKSVSPWYRSHFLHYHNWVIRPKLSVITKNNKLSFAMNTFASIAAPVIFGRLVGNQFVIGCRLNTHSSRSSIFENGTNVHVHCRFDGGGAARHIKLNGNLIGIM